MEQAVHRWDALLTKGEIQLTTGSPGTTTAPLKRLIEDIKKRIKTTEKVLTNFTNYKLVAWVDNIRTHHDSARHVSWCHNQDQASLDHYQ